jgi:hypothetical protein
MLFESDYQNSELKNPYLNKSGVVRIRGVGLKDVSRDVVSPEHPAAGGASIKTHVFL